MTRADRVTTQVYACGPRRRAVVAFLLASIYELPAALAIADHERLEAASARATPAPDAAAADYAEVMAALRAARRIDDAASWGSLRDASSLGDASSGYDDDDDDDDALRAAFARGVEAQRAERFRDPRRVLRVC